jgi:hypothetical protein
MKKVSDETPNKTKLHRLKLPAAGISICVNGDETDQQGLEFAVQLNSGRRRLRSLA